MNDLKKMSDKELALLAENVRHKILTSVSKNGGHLSSNLGVVELTISLHKTFDLPKDQIIFDVSHQSYTHKILTEREEAFDELRQFGGLSGFTNPLESRYDTFSVGHSSTAVSLAIGQAIKNKELNINASVISVVGDASATNGLTLEALNFLGAHPELKVIIVINDNDMSVSKNVGAVARTFNKIRIKRDKSFVYKLTPKCIHGFIDKIKNSLKGAIYRKNLFDSFGIKYFQGIDGHNFKELDKYLTFAKNYSKSVILHVKTKKGKGYKFAEEDNIGLWHNVGPFNLETGEFTENHAVDPVGKYLSEVLIEEVEKDSHIKVINAAMSLGNSLTLFQNAYPNHTIDVGIAEENAVTIASSIASKEITPVVFIYSTFLQRAYDEILHDVARCNKHVVFCIDRSGIVPHDGSTHQGIFDISYLSPIPNMMIIAPSTVENAKSALKFAIKQNCPVAIRYPKYLPSVNNDNFTPLKWNIELPIQEINVISYGSDIEPLREILKEYNVGLINAMFIKPIDETILNNLAKSKKLIIYEQVNDVASLFDLINNYYQKNNCDVNLKHIALHDTYLTEGSVDELKDKYHISYDEVLKEIK